MSDAKSEVKNTPIVPMANLVHGTIFDKRQLSTSFDRVVKAVGKINAEFAAVLQEGKGYTLIADPFTLDMAKQQQEQFQQPPAQPQYQRQPHMMIGGYGGPFGGGVAGFGIVPNGHDRVMILPIRPDVLNSMVLNQLSVTTPGQLIAIQFDQLVGRILGDVVDENRGFVAE
jgi:hypothetical protein